MAYKNAFNCKKCPESNSPQGCPCWMETVWENADTNEKKVEKGCFFQEMPKLMLETVKAANVGAEHACQMRNGFAKLATIAKDRMLLKG